MAKSVHGKTLGRPSAHIDWPIFEGLCEIQCTASEISSVFRICEDTLYKKVIENYKEHFSVIYKRYSEGGKSSLRRIQFNLAKKNTSMAIWLGKQWLGQKDISRDEVKDIGQDIINAIRESEARARVDETIRSSLENQQPLLDKGCPRETRQVHNELGTARVVCQPA